MNFKEIAQLQKTVTDYLNHALIRHINYREEKMEKKPIHDTPILKMHDQRDFRKENFSENDILRQIGEHFEKIKQTPYLQRFAACHVLLLYMMEARLQHIHETRVQKLETWQFNDALLVIHHFLIHQIKHSSLKRAYDQTYLAINTACAIEAKKGKKADMVNFELLKKKLASLGNLQCLVITVSNSRSPAIIYDEKAYTLPENLNTDLNKLNQTLALSDSDNITPPSLRQLYTYLNNKVSNIINIQITLENADATLLMETWQDCVATSFQNMIHDDQNHNHLISLLHQVTGFCVKIHRSSLANTDFHSALESLRMILICFIKDYAPYYDKLCDVDNQQKIAHQEWFDTKDLNRQELAIKIERAAFLGDEDAYAAFLLHQRIEITPANKRLVKNINENLYDYFQEFSQRPTNFNTHTKTSSSFYSQQKNDDTKTKETIPPTDAACAINARERLFTPS